MKIFLDMVGCRLNQSEIEMYARQFVGAGHTLTDTPGEADLIVINTCTVTSAADSDSRQKIRQAARLGRGQIIVTGCWSTMFPEEAASLPQVCQVVPNQFKDELVAEFFKSQGQIMPLESDHRQTIPGGRMRTRAFIKVQDGCDNRCTFCITTLARGSSRSQPIEKVIADIHLAMTDDPQNPGSAAREVVLTGVHLGAWGREFSPALELRHLIEAVLKDTDIERVRLSSLEPWDLNDDFFKLWENPRLCPHLHLPLQSGSAGVLRRMGRKVTPQSYAYLLAQARQVIPEVAITTDLIAGFSGETETEFDEGLTFVQQMEFAGGHVFTYSPRPGTAAYGLQPQIPLSLRKERSARLRLILEEANRSYRMRYIHKCSSVLWERAEKFGSGYIMEGLTANYLHVTAFSPVPLWNQFSEVRLDAVTKDGLQGTIVALDQSIFDWEAQQKNKKQEI
ncbi:MAG: MiaB/RimO family radical SAM methylthiotransferase [Chloroflexi bacterium]|nr:MiaB/RimO family radical SAM methylthiotransferase [Chloroflexota bacterium]